MSQLRLKKKKYMKLKQYIAFDILTALKVYIIYKMKSPFSYSN